MTPPHAGDIRDAVGAIRNLLAQRLVPVLICAAALLLKVLVPTGYMIVPDDGRITVAVCSGFGPQTMEIVIPGMDHATPGSDSSKDGGAGDMPCAFAGLSTQFLGAVDAVLLVAALAIVAGQALRPMVRRLPRAALYLRPPLRGPPLLI